MCCDGPADNKVSAVRPVLFIELEVICHWGDDLPLKLEDQVFSRHNQPSGRTGMVGVFSALLLESCSSGNTLGFEPPPLT